MIVSQALGTLTLRMALRVTFVVEDLEPSVATSLTVSTQDTFNGT